MKDIVENEKNLAVSWNALEFHFGNPVGTMLW